MTADFKILLVIFFIWIVIVNISKVIINYLEFRPEIEKSSVIAKIIDYRWNAKAKPVIIAKTLSEHEIVIIDHKRKYKAFVNANKGEWVRIEFYNHCTGIFVISLEGYIYDIKLYDPDFHGLKK